MTRSRWKRGEVLRRYDGGFRRRCGGLIVTGDGDSGLEKEKTSEVSSAASQLILEPWL